MADLCRMIENDNIYPIFCKKNHFWWIRYVTLSYLLNYNISFFWEWSNIFRRFSSILWESEVVKYQHQVDRFTTPYMLEQNGKYLINLEKVQYNPFEERIIIIGKFVIKQAQTHI